MGVVDDFLTELEQLEPDLGRRPGRPAGGRACAEATTLDPHARRWPTPNDALAGATPVPAHVRLVTGGWVMARQALAARTLGRDDKLTTARFYLSELLPQATGLLPAVTAGQDVLFALTPDQLDSRH